MKINLRKASKYEACIHEYSAYANDPTSKVIGYGDTEEEALIKFIRAYKEEQARKKE